MQNESPEQPTLPVDTQNTTQSSRKKPLIIAVIIATVIVIAVGVYFLNNSRTNMQSKSKVTSNNLVAYTPDPARVGSFPAIGACQVVPKEDVYNAFGKDFLPTPNVTNEKYQQLTLPNPRYGEDDAVAISECEHISAVGGSNKKVTVAVIQFQSLEQRQKKMSSATNLEAQNADEINTLKTKLKTKLSPESEKFLSEVAQTTDEFANALSKPGANMSKILDNKVLLGVVRSSTTSEFAAELYAKNAVVSLSIVASDEKRKVEDISDEQMVAMVDSIRKVSESIYSNMRDTSKLTAPAPTADRKTVPSSDGLAIVDACNIFTPKSFVTLSGVEENVPLERTNFMTLGKEDLTSEITNPNRYSTSCTREYAATKTADIYAKTAAENAYGLGGYARIHLQVGHAKNETAITKAMKSYREAGAGALKTTAEETYRNTINPNLAVFRKGKYIVNLSVDKVNVNSKSFANGKQTVIPISEAELTAAINEFVTKIP